MTNRHYNVLKPAIMARFFTSFDYIMNKIIYYVLIKYSMCDLICDVITCCV